MDLNEVFFVQVRETVERNTGRPPYLCTDEEWLAAVDEVMTTKVGEVNHAMPPVCDHCGSVAPYGDARMQWISVHLDSRLHRWWWKTKRRKR